MQFAKSPLGLTPQVVSIFLSNPDQAAFVEREYNSAGLKVQKLTDKDTIKNKIITSQASILHTSITEPTDSLDLLNIKAGIVWDLRGVVQEKFLSSLADESKFDRWRSFLRKVAVVLNDSPVVANLIEEKFKISTALGLEVKQAIKICNHPILIGVGAGMGNVLETTPLIKKVSLHLGYPIDVYINSPVPAVEGLLGGSPYVNMAYGDFSDVSYKSYEKSFITASAGHVIPPLNSNEKFVQRRVYEMMHECKTMHESEFNFLGIENLFPEIKKPEETWRHFFIRDTAYTCKPGKVVGICDGKVPGKWQLREWNNFDELSAKLTQAGYEVRSFGVSGQYVPGSVDKTGTSLRVTLENLQECSFFIASDGGLAHLAECTGIPTIVLFGPTSIIKNGPIAPWARALHAKTHCSPCQWKTDFVKCTDNICMTGITSENIISALEELETLVASNAILTSPASRSFYADVIQHELERDEEPCRPELIQEFTDESFSDYPNSAAFFMRAAQGNMRFGRIQRAQLIINRGLEKFPQDLSLRRLQVECLFREKEFEAARASSIELLSQNKDVTSLVILHYRIALKLELWSEVASHQLVETKNSKDDAELGWLVGFALREMGKIEAARKAFEFSEYRRPGVSRISDALNTLRDDVYRKPNFRKPICAKSSIKLAILSESPQEVLKDLKAIRSHLEIFIFSFNQFDELIKESKFFDYIWVFGLANEIEQYTDKIPLNLQEQLLIETENEFSYVANGEDNEYSREDFIREKLAPTDYTPCKEGRYSKKRFIVFAHHHMARWSPHGGEKSMLAIAQYLIAEGAELLVVVANMKTPDVFCERYEGVSYVVSSKWRYIDVLKEVLLSYQPDAALTWGPQSLESGPLASSLKIPYCLFVRYWKVVQDPPYDSESLEENPDQAALAKYGPVYSNASVVITNGQYVTDVVDRKFSVQSRVAYVPVKSPPLDFKPLVRNERPFVTLVNPRKAQGEIIIRELAKRLPHIKFHVVGEPSIKLPVNVKIDPYFSGHYTEMLKYARVLLFPWGEVPCGTGRVVFEAYYAGVPVVSVDIGGMKEVISKDFLVPENDDIDGWVLAVEKAYSYNPDSLYDDLRSKAEEFPEEQGIQVLNQALHEMLVISSQ